MGCEFMVSLAFYRNTNSTVAVNYNYDFALFKQTPRPRLPKVAKTVGRLTVVEKDDQTLVKNVENLESAPSVEASQSADPLNAQSVPSGVEQESISRNEPEPENVTNQAQEADGSRVEMKAEEPGSDASVAQRVIGHIEVQNVSDFKKEQMQKNLCPKLLVVRVQKYPNLLKRYKEGKVVEPKHRTRLRRLCQIKRKNVARTDILDLDYLAHVASANENKAVEVETLPEGTYRQSYECKNPVPPDPNDDDLTPTDAYADEPSSQDDEDVLWDKSQQKLAEIKGNRHSASANKNLSTQIIFFNCILLSYTSIIYLPY